MTKEHSPYYPRRARWFAPAAYLVTPVRRHLALEKLHLPQGVSPAGFLLSVLVPGVAFYVRGSRLFGWLAISACLFLTGVFFACLGYPIANIAIALSFGTHASGLVLLMKSWIEDCSLRYRVLFTLGVLGALGLILYAPALHLLERNWFMPLRARDTVVVVKRMDPSAKLHLDDQIAYLLYGGESWGPVRVSQADGIGLGPILALPGDTVVFTPFGYEVNGVAHPRLGYMPIDGVVTVGTDSWFVWPDLAVYVHGNIPEAQIAGRMLGLASVHRSQLIGRPYKRWFFRKQVSS